MPSKAISDLVASINGTMGKGTITTASDNYYVVEYLRTGIAPIDDLLHGGIPYGRFVEIFGDYSTLKSYVALCAIRECQRAGKLAALIDTEHSFDPKWAEEIGVNLDDLIIKRPHTGEEAIDVAEILVRGGVDFIVFDSVAAALPKAEKDIMLSGDKNVQPARLASLMSLAMRKLTAANRKTAILWINQTRVNVGVMFGSNESVPGGKALPFYASYRIALRKAARVTEDMKVTVMKDGKPTKAIVKLTIAQSIRATVEKSKLSSPHRDVMFNFDFRTGKVDDWWYLATQAMDEGLVTYDRGYWWLTKGRTPTKHRGRAAFQKIMPEDKLRLLLAGKLQPAKKSVAVPKKSTSKPVVRRSTPTAARAKSSSTVATKKASSSTRMPTKVSRSRKVS